MDKIKDRERGLPRAKLWQIMPEDSRKKNWGERLFDYEGVRRCVQHLHDRGYEVVGVISESFKETDRGRDKSVPPYL